MSRTAYVIIIVILALPLIYVTAYMVMRTYLGSNEGPSEAISISSTICYYNQDKLIRFQTQPDAPKGEQWTYVYDPLIRFELWARDEAGEEISITPVTHPTPNYSKPGRPVIQQSK